MYREKRELVNKIVESASNRSSEFDRRIFCEKSVSGLTEVKRLLSEVFDVLLEEFFLKVNLPECTGQIKRCDALDPVIFAIREGCVFRFSVNIVFLAEFGDVLSPDRRLVDRITLSSWHRSSSLDTLH